MKFILGTKRNMAQIYEASGEAVPVTIIDVGPIVVTQVKDKAKDGYSAVQFGFGSTKEKSINKAQKGHFKNLGNFNVVKEWRISEPNLKVGDTVKAGIFVPGDFVKVSAISKGKGYQGVVKRHGFKGGSRTHGQKHSEREAGSIGGAGRAGGRVAKGMRMAGRMGGERITVRNLKVIQVDEANNTLLLRGAVPGKRGTLVEIRSNE